MNLFGDMGIFTIDSHNHKHQIPLDGKILQIEVASDRYLGFLRKITLCVGEVKWISGGKHVVRFTGRPRGPIKWANGEEFNRDRRVSKERFLKWVEVGDFQAVSGS
jgi:hypothetical protein